MIDPGKDFVWNEVQQEAVTRAMDKVVKGEGTQFKDLMECLEEIISVTTGLQRERLERWDTLSILLLVLDILEVNTA